MTVREQTPRQNRFSVERRLSNQIERSCLGLSQVPPAKRDALRQAARLA